MANPENEFSNSIFKFFGIDCHNLDNLEKRELYCKCYDNYNDTYEGHFGASNAGYESSLVLKAFRANEKYYRTCCFTRQWNNVLMWAHYAKGFSGVALVLDKKSILENPSLRFVGEDGSGVDMNAVGLEKIKYKNRPPILSNSAILAIKNKQNSNNQAAREYLEVTALTKCKTWKYEKESRMIICLEQHQFEKRAILYKYNEQALKGVIIGNRCTEDDIKKIAERVNQTTYVYTARPIKDRYKFEICGKYLAGDIVTGKVVLKTVRG
jgi:hypothetical protein